MCINDALMFELCDSLFSRRDELLCHAAFLLHLVSVSGEVKGQVPKCWDCQAKNTHIHVEGKKNLIMLKGH